MKTLREMMDLIESAQADVAEGLADTQQKIQDTINKLEDRLKHAKTPEQWDNIKNRIERLQAGLKRSQQGVAEGLNDTVYPNAEVIKSKNGKPVGEIYQDESGWGCFHYRADRGASHIESREEALEWLKDIAEEYRQDRSLREQGVAEEQVEESTPDALAKINDLFRK